MPAVAGVAALDLVVVGFVALLLAVALFPLFRPVIGNGLSQLPIVGAAVAARVDIVLAVAYTSALGFIEASISPLTDFVRRLRLALQLWTQWSVGAAEATAVKLWAIRYQVIPQLESDLVRFAQALAAQAMAYAAALFASAIQFALSLFGQAVQYAQALFAQAIAYAQALSASDLAYAQALFAQAITYTQQAAQADALYTQQAVLGAERYARGLFGEAVDYTQQAVLGAERYAQGIGVDAEGYAQALQRQALGYVDQVAGQVLAQAVTADAAVAARVEEIERSDCMRNCNPLGEIGDLVQGLQDAGLFSILLALAVQASRDPQSVAQEMGDVFSPPLHAILGELGVKTP